MNISKPKGTRRVLSELVEYLKPYRGKILLMYVFALINVATMIALPVLIQRGIDYGIVPRNMEYLLVVSGILLATGAVQFVSFRMQGVLMMQVGNGVLYDLRKNLFDHIQHLSVGFFDRNKSGRLMTRLTGDILVLEELLMTGLDTLLVDSLMIIGLVTAMVLMNGWLSLTLLFILPVLFLIVFKLRGRIVESANGIQKKLSRVNSFLNESLSGIQVSRAFAREGQNIEKFRELNGEYYTQSRTFYPLNAFFWQSVATLNNFSQGLVIIGGGILLYHGMITIGVIVAFLNYVTRLFQPMQKISNMLNQMSRAVVSGSRIFEILHEKKDVDDVSDPVKPDDLKGDVRFENVHFAYKEGEPVLNGVDLHVKPGQICAIVGHTGSGKSTMVNLVNRFYDVQEGSIRIDGVDIRSYDQQELRSRMAAVMQDPQIFSGTVEENIRFGDPDADSHLIRDVVQQLGIHRLIEAFPRGYDTELGQNGGSISLGQRQLIAFARALVRNPSILILDEASSYLDSETEQMVQKALVPLMEGRTSFVIAHRLSTIRNADIILVLNQGELAEQGTHVELLARNGLYADFLRQSPREINEPTG
ncbi:ABC transporter ATP-binding protein [Salinispira pacifica]|uniref:ABC transporter, ATP-binding/permease protein n=1 Tax=Salinispira pacifica TaxID=1307761 RepID=V5WM78_9SPIO|nr:ABC transporter ATP-binding protein [Salinispira pacifica]AHC16743.1 ABC transporter, ATP-binding/permease protein [Salinispira pacifica]